MSHPTPAGSVIELLAQLDGITRLDGEQLVIEDEMAFRDRGIRAVAWTATFSDDEPTVEAARWIVWEASILLGAPSASIHELYMARGRGELGGFTVPAINLRTQVMDMSGAILRAAAGLEAGTVILELARSEQEYTYQRPGEFITSVLAGAIAAGWRGPVFVQGDHYQFNVKKYVTDPEGTTEAIRKATADAVRAGYRNIDIDSSTLVDLTLPDVDSQQRTNYERAAEITAVIREVEPEGETVSVGGEIGEVGKENSNEAELRVYLDGYRRELARRAGAEAIGVSKVSVQTGTSHGGVPLPGGGVAEVALDFDTLRRLSEVCREYGLAGAVQHGASTLPDELFHRFPEVETAEVHLATGFQNLLYDHSAFPPELRTRIEDWCRVNTADEWKPGEDESVSLYKTRKKALGPFKRELWELTTRDEIIATQEAKFRYLFDQLGIAGSRQWAERYIRPQPKRRPAPPALREAVAAR
ncbi:MAG: class II fructose-bisphosphate aldolase [Chloroflexi bacterium]|nr:class II fructose-bisphosphate aldolase [Chloroflexota bacterium]